MRPLVIEMQAFGPFAQRQVIDFRVLGSHTFFLIHGPTGSGKTSILDAMCFALFGDSSGGEREGRQMRSHHAHEATLTEVCFEFALGGARYRVRRVPEQMRQARRGGGETRQAQGAELWRIDAPPDAQATPAQTHPLASGWSKVSEAVVGLLGFQSQQFRQVIVLPQGKFFEFLKSSSQEREKILQTLFGTMLYKRIEDALKQSATELAREIELTGSQRTALLAQAQADGEAALQARRQQQEEALHTQREAERAAAAAAQSAAERLAEARRMADRFTELDQAVAARQALAEREPAERARHVQLQAARRAAAVQPYVSALAELARQREVAARQGERLAAALADATALRERSDAALAQARRSEPEAERLIGRLSELEALAGKVATLAEARAQHAAAQQEAKRATDTLAAARRAHQAALAAQQGLVAELQAQRVRAAGLDSLRATHQRLTTRLSLRRNLDDLRTEHEAASRQAQAGQVALAEAETAAAAARARRDACRRDWVAGQAARLAHELVDGRPCPVCGAHEHPSPALVPPTGEGLVLDTDLQAAEDALARAETAQRTHAQRLATQRQAVDTLATRLEVLRTTLGETPESPAQLTQQADAIQAQLTQAEAALQACAQLEARQPGADQAVQQTAQVAQQAEALAQQAQAAALRQAGQLAEREAGIPEPLREPAALQAALAQTRQQHGALKQALADAMASNQQAVSRWTEARANAQFGEQERARLAQQHEDKSRDLDQRLQDAGFPNAQAQGEAWLDDERMNALETALREFDAALAAGTERLLRAEAGARGLVRPDITALGAAAEAAQAALQAAAQAVRETQLALAGTRHFCETLARLAESLQALEARYVILKQVANVAGGTNAQRMSFQRYVLATLLEEVLAATTLRLRVMSAGRYEMRRKRQPVDQRAAAGLDLEVFDQYTGTLRAVGTLSGGESFLASLALALGLSDVVQAHAGGIRLDAIFVDEGFGTLDAEALDHAIRALKDLQQAGRLVGIISHATELREWIDTRLELKATPQGSTAAFTTS